MAFAMTLEGDGGVRPSFLEVAVTCAEMVVQGTFLPNTVFLPSLHEAFHIEVGEDFEEEHAAKQGQQQLFVHDDGRHRDDAADGQTARVAHEDLCREGVEPQEAYECAYKSSHKDHQLLAAWDVHQIEVACCDGITGDVSQDE